MALWPFDGTDHAFQDWLADLSLMAGCSDLGVDCGRKRETGDEMQTGTSRGRRGRCALERRGGATQPQTSCAPPRLTARLAKATPDPERLACGRGKRSLTSTGPLRKRHVLTCSFGFLLAVFV
jgi:hypothetical protein